KKKKKGNMIKMTTAIGESQRLLLVLCGTVVMTLVGVLLFELPWHQFPNAGELWLFWTSSIGVMYLCHASLYRISKLVDESEKKRFASKAKPSLQSAQVAISKESQVPAFQPAFPVQPQLQPQPQSLSQSKSQSLSQSSQPSPLLHLQIQTQIQSQAQIQTQTQTLEMVAKHIGASHVPMIATINPSNPTLNDSTNPQQKQEDQKQDDAKKENNPRHCSSSRH
ncbi:NDT80/PhoG-like protein, partial [Reticulomyxa filosa]